MNSFPKSFNLKFWTACTAAVTAAAASALCCIGPLVYLVFGVSSAWLMGLSEYEYLRIPMLIVSLVAFGYGFWLLNFSAKVICSRYLSRKTLQILYWLMFVIILFFLAYPTVLPWILELTE